MTSRIDGSTTYSYDSRTRLLPNEEIAYRAQRSIIDFYRDSDREFPMLAPYSGVVIFDGYRGNRRGKYLFRADGIIGPATMSMAGYLAQHLRKPSYVNALERAASSGAMNVEAWNFFCDLSFFRFFPGVTAVRSVTIDSVTGLPFLYRRRPGTSSVSDLVANSRDPESVPVPYYQTNT